MKATEVKTRKPVTYLLTSTCRKAIVNTAKYILLIMKVFLQNKGIKGTKFIKRPFGNLYLFTEFATYFVTFDGGAKTP